MSTSAQEKGQVMASATMERATEVAVEDTKVTAAPAVTVESAAASESRAKVAGHSFEQDEPRAWNSRAQVD
jgi:hypothetical protein